MHHSLSVLILSVHLMYHTQQHHSTGSSQPYKQSKKEAYEGLELCSPQDYCYVAIIHPQPPVHLPSSCLGGKCLMVYEVIPCNRKKWKTGSCQEFLAHSNHTYRLAAKSGHWSIEFLHIVGAGGCLVVIIHYWQHKPWVWFPSFSIPSYIHVQVFPIKHAAIATLFRTSFTFALMTTGAFSRNVGKSYFPNSSW